MMIINKRIGIGKPDSRCNKKTDLSDLLMKPYQLLMAEIVVYSY